MGKSSSFKNSGSPDRAYPNEFQHDQETSFGEDESKQKSKLTINLVQIDSDIASQTSQGDLISLSDKGQTIEVLTADGRIGNIPIHEIDDVRSFNYSKSYVSGIKSGNYRVQITLKV